MSDPLPKIDLAELQQLIQILNERFILRRDLHVVQRADGAYLSIKSPLTDNQLKGHLLGDITLGSYALDANSYGRFMVFDADDEPDWRRLSALAAVLAEMGGVTYLEKSRRGGHLWFFFEEPLSGKTIRQFGLGLLNMFNIDEMELFPKQEQLRGGPGSSIRLPFGIHKKSGRRYGFYQLDGRPLAPTLREQLRVLANPMFIPQRLIDFYASYAPLPASEKRSATFEPVSVVGDLLSDKITSAISVRQFVEQYADVSAAGMARCPFHDDQVASLSVNDRDNYWHCFAGCGGGSIIHFYRLYQERVLGRPCDYKTALAELAELLLI